MLADLYQTNFLALLRYCIRFPTHLIVSDPALVFLVLSRCL